MSIFLFFGFGQNFRKIVTRNPGLELRPPCIEGPPYYLAQRRAGGRKEEKEEEADLR